MRHCLPTVVTCVALGALLLACDEPAEFEGDHAGECSDGADNDRDGAFDCDDSDCAAGPDCSGVDAGPGVSDSGVDDAGARADGAVPDGGAPDGAVPDGGAGDSGTGDSGTGDAGTGDAGTGDAGTGDGGTGDAGVDAGPSLPPLAFLLTDLDVGDPEPSASFGTCFDLTAGADMLLQPANHAIVFPAFDATLATQPVEIVSYPSCTATTCTTDASSVVASITATLSMTGGEACLEPVPSTTPPTYTANRPVHPCFSSGPFDVSIATSGDDIPLTDARVAASFSGASPETLVDGLLYGFISETDADTVMMTISGVTRSLWDVLPGGGGCRGGDQRDTHEGESGWWLYFHFDADEIGWTAP